MDKHTNSFMKPKNKKLNFKQNTFYHTYLQYISNIF